MTIRTAACACGRLTATCEGEPVRVSICHCTECKRRTGGAFSWNSRWPTAAVRIEGESRGFTRRGEEGGTVTHHFCPECGVTVWYETGDTMDTVAIPVGAFATPDFPQPTVSVYDVRRQPWLRIEAEPLTVID